MPHAPSTGRGLAQRHGLFGSRDLACIHHVLDQCILLKAVINQEHRTASMAAQLAVDVFEQERRRLELAAVELRTSLAEKDVQLTERCSEAAREEAKLLQLRYASELNESKSKENELRKHLQDLGRSAQLQAKEMNVAEEELKEAEEYESACLHRKEARQEVQARFEKVKKDCQIASLRSEIQVAIDSRTADELQLTQLLRVKEEHAQKEAGTKDTDSMTLQEQVAADLKDQLFESQETVASLEESFQSMQSLCLKTEAHIEEMLQDSTIEAQACQKDEDTEAQEELLEESRKLDKADDQINQVQRLYHIAEGLAAELRKSGPLVAKVRV